MAEEEKDDWLADLDDDGDDSGEMDQNDIDSLLAGEEESDESTGDLSDDSLLDGELDQANIDALLAGGKTDETETAEEGSAELDQGDIDSLFDSPAENTAEEATVAAPQEEDDQAENTGDELDQADIDSLLSGDSGADPDLPDISPDQEEIDRLFSEIDDDEEEADPFQAEEIDFQDVLDSEEGGDAVLSTGNEFADDDFNFDDDLEIPDIPLDEETAVLAASEQSDASQTVSATQTEAKPEEEEEKENEHKKFTLPEIPLPPILQNRRNQGIGAGLILLLLCGLFLLRGGSDDNEQIAEKSGQTLEETAPPQQTEQQPEPQRELKPNAVPEVANAELELNSSARPLAIELHALDPENDELTYEILTEPEHGSLKGEAPYLIYTPNEEFAESDMFQFRVSDGRDFSAPASVTIINTKKPQTRNLPEQQKPKKIAALKPKKLIIAAKDIAYSLIGTEDFYIDWQHVWEAANDLPYNKQVGVEILTKNIQGTLTRVNNSLHKYRAQKYAGGLEAIRYRFKLGKLISKTRVISLNIDPGDPAPEVVIQPVAQSYKPGEKVVLDAAASLDEERDNLRFSWQQMSGSPVLIEYLNREHSRIAFIAPSSFNTVKEPGPLMRVTVTDHSGQTTFQDIKVATKSRFHSALWGGVAAVGN